jgi:hypothetical protein
MLSFDSCSPSYYPNGAVLAKSHLHTFPSSIDPARIRRILCRNFHASRASRYENICTCQAGEKFELNMRNLILIGVPSSEEVSQKCVYQLRVHMQRSTLPDSVNNVIPTIKNQKSFCSKCTGGGYQRRSSNPAHRTTYCRHAQNNDSFSRSPSNSWKCEKENKKPLK